MKANTAGGMANAGADFEELSAQGFNLCGAPGQGQLQTEKVDQVVSGGVQQLGMETLCVSGGATAASLARNG